MEAAEKIPKKLYVYLDTTRGLNKRNGCKNVHHLGPRYSLRYHRKRDIWADTLHFGRIIMSRKSKKHGALPSGENVAPNDYRGREGHVKDVRRVKAPDGISGDWGK